MRRRFLVGLLVAMCCAACAGESDELSLAQDANQIIGGAAFTGLPAVGALTYDGYQSCTGTLIGPRKVVTAGHCVAGMSANRSRFVVGASLSSAEHVLAIASMQACPG